MAFSSYSCTARSPLACLQKTRSLSIYSKYRLSQLTFRTKKKKKIFRIPYSTPLLSKTIFTLFYPKRCQRISTLISKVLRHHRAHINTLLVSYLKYNAGKILLFIPSKRYLINLNFKPYLPKRIAVISVN